MRSFVRYCVRNNLARVAAIGAVRNPKRPQAMPKPLSVDDALAALDQVAALAARPWVGKAWHQPWDKVGRDLYTLVENEPDVERFCQLVEVEASPFGRGLT